MSGYVGVSGAWKEIENNSSVGVSGAWKAIDKMWVGVSGAWKEFYQNALLVSGITVDTGTIYAGYFGIDYGDGVYGAISDGTFNDYGENARTVVAVVKDQAETVLAFILSGSVPNTDTSFISITLPGGTFTRAAATYVNPDTQGNTTWSWAVGSDPFAADSTPALTVQ